MNNRLEVAKFFSTNVGDLNPRFGVLLSAISHGLSWGNFHQGWKTTESSGNKIVVNCSQSTYKFSICFDHKLPLREDLKNPSNKVI